MSWWPSFLSSLWSSRETQPVEAPGEELESPDTASFAALAGPRALDDASASEPAVDQQLPVSPGAVPRLEEALRNSQLRVVFAPPSVIRTLEDPAPLADVEFSRDFQIEILKARDPEPLSALVPNFLLHLANHPSLDSADPRWHPRARIGRALRAGISARRVLDDEFGKQARSPSVPFENKIYICLRCIRSEAGWWTDSYSVYWPCIETPDPSGPRVFQNYSISHGFHTLSEGEAFLRGARRTWPRFLRAATDL